MNRLETTAHRLQGTRATHPLLDRTLNLAPVKSAYKLAGFGLRQYRDLTIPCGRFDFDNANALCQEALKRGALQKEEELSCLLGMLMERELNSVMEIGTARGGTFFALAHLATKHAKLTSIDMPGGEFGGGYSPRGEDRLRSYALPSQRLRLFQGDSHSTQTYDNVLRWLDGDPLDFLLIDGDHTLEGVTRDWEMYSPLVRFGGLIAIHDINPHETVPRCKVDEFWVNKIEPNHQTDRIISPPLSWGGIGVVFK